MATDLGQLKYILTLEDTGFKGQLAAAEGQVASTSTSMGASLANTGKSMESMGRSISSAGAAFMPFSLAAGVGLGFAVKAATDFHQSMMLVQTQAGASAEEVNHLTGEILKMAPALGKTPRELADALFYIESSGIRGAKALDVLKLSAEGASVGQTSVAETTNALTSLLNSNIKGAENATVAMSNLNGIVGAGKMHFADLNAAISTGFFGAAASFGVSLDSAGAAVAALTRLGMPAVDAANRLRMSMTLMSTPTNKAQKVLEAAGFSMNEITTNSATMTAALSKAHVKTSELAADLQKPDGFNVAIEHMRSKLVAAGISGNDAASIISAAFGGGRTSGPILQMLNSQGAVKNAFDQLGSSAKDFGKSVDAQNETSKQAMDRFKASIATLGVQIGDAFLPTLDKVIGYLSKAATWFGTLNPHVKTAAVVVLALVAVIGPLLVGLGAVITAAGTIATAIGAISLPVAAVIVGISLLTAYLLTHHAALMKLEQFMKTAMHNVLSALKLAWEVLKPPIEALWHNIEHNLLPALLHLWNVVKPVLIPALEILGAIIIAQVVAAWWVLINVLNIVVHAISDVIQWVANIIHWVQDIPQAFRLVARAASDLWKDVTSFFSQMWNEVVQGFNGFLQGLSQFVSNVVQWFKDIPHGVVIALDDMAFAFGRGLRMLWDLATQWIPKTVVSIWQEMQRLPGQIWGVMVDVYNAVNAAASSIWSSLVNWFRRTGNDVTNTTANMVNNVENWIWQLPGRIANAAGALWGAANRAASGIWHGIMDTIYQLPGLLDQVFDNLWRKITGWAGKLADGAKHVASSMWNSFKDGIGMHSPSHFERAFDQITNSSDRAVSDMTKNVNRLTAVQMGAMPVGGSITVGGSANGGGGNTNNAIHYNIAEVKLTTAEATREFFSIGNRNSQLQASGLSPLAGTTSV